MLSRLDLHSTDPAHSTCNGVVEAVVADKGAKRPCPRLEQKTAANAVIVEADSTDVLLVKPGAVEGGLGLHALAPHGVFHILNSAADLGRPLGCTVSCECFCEEAALLSS